MRRVVRSRAPESTMVHQTAIDVGGGALRGATALRRKPVRWVGAKHTIHGMQRLARWILKLFGWSLEYADPGTRKYVLIFAPHTSNWDFPVGLLAAWALDLRVHWMGKDSLFRSPLGPLFRAWRGIPVDRGRAGNSIEKMAERFAEKDRFVLAIAPEGTRSATDHWKSGFWYIARAAQVPVAMAYIDYPRKQVGLGRTFTPGEDLEHDFQQIRDFYADRRGRYPAQESDIRPRQR